MKARRMAYRRNTDPILSAVIAEINKSAVKPDAGFFKRDDWAKKWKMTNSQAAIYLDKALASGILITRRFRVITNGRLRVLDHYGPPGRTKNKNCPQRNRRP